jgi:pyruvate formate lyase activating enzyme
MDGIIFSVKRYSINDGPGIRVTFFLKGCPMLCSWCHNPEGISPEPEIIGRTDRIGEMIFHRTEMAGKSYSVKDVIDILDRERPFIEQSNGGVTFSGGEPMMQTGFLLEALKACKESNYHTAVDTSGYTSSDNFRSVIPFTDLFLYDIKHLDDAKHIMYTGVTNKEILKNYILTLDSGSDVIVRIPVIPGFNDDPDHLKRLKEFIISTKTNALKKICLLPFHKTGAAKYKRLNIPNRMINAKQPDDERMKELRTFFSETDVGVKIGG